MEFVVMVFLGLFLVGIYQALFGQWKAFKEFPTLTEYLKRNPDCKTSSGIKCNICNSKSIKNWGFRNPSDTHRLFICNHCNTTLYRTDSLPLSFIDSVIDNEKKLKDWTNEK